MTLRVRLRTLILFSGIFLLCLTGAAKAAAAQESPEQRITGIRWQQTTDAFLLTVSGDGPPTYTIYELFNPLRIILDIADARLAESAGLPMHPSQGPVSKITGRLLDDQGVLITRIELFLSEDLAYSTERIANQIVLKFPSAPALASVLAPAAA
jgi:type IV pilus assembly protein PilQ